MWYAVAEYADGTRIEKYFPYHENGNYNAECERMLRRPTHEGDCGL